MENKLRLLFILQKIDSEKDDILELKGDLPEQVEKLKSQLSEKKARIKELEEEIKKSAVDRDAHDLEIISLREKIEKYKAQQFEVKTNKQYDALTREIEFAQDRINTLQREIDLIEGKGGIAESDIASLKPMIEELQKDLDERSTELELVNQEHEDEELKLQHERDKIVVQLVKSDLKAYERIREAKDGIAVVPIRRNACGGCFKRVPPQTMQELRKNDQLLVCEHCGRIIVSDEIVDRAIRN